MEHSPASSDCSYGTSFEDRIGDMFDAADTEDMVPKLHETWKLLKRHFLEPLSIRSFDELNRRFPGEYDWESILFEAERDFLNECLAHKEKERVQQSLRLLIEVYQEASAQLPEIDGHNLLNLRKAVAEFYFFAGYVEQGEAQFQHIIEEKPDWVWAYTGWGDMYTGYGPDDLRSPEKAAAIYKQGLEKCSGKDDLETLEERLDMLKGK